MPAYIDFEYSHVDSTNTSGDDNFRKGAIKLLCQNNRGLSNVNVFGAYHPNSQGPLIGQIYNTSTVDSTTGLPQYSTFWGSNLAGSIEIFGTTSYNYYHRTVLDSSNYTSYTVKKDGTGASGTWGINVTGSAGSVAWGNITGKPSFNYLPLAGGTMTGLLQAHGGISLNNSTPQETPLYILGIRAFADGGNIIWQSTNNISVGYATTASALAYPAQISTQSGLDAFKENQKFKIGYWNSFTPTGLFANGIILSGGWASDNFGFQIAIDDDPTWKIALRQKGTTWSDWKYIPMADGTNASGSWDIDIKRSANSATYASDGTHIANTYLRNDKGFQAYSVVFVPSYATEGWYRVACIGGLKGYFAGFVTITGNWHYGEPSSVILTISGTHNSPAITQIGGTNGSVFSEVRLTGADGQYYLELYCKGAYGEISNQYVTIYGTLNASTTYSPTTPNGSEGSYTAYVKLQSKGNINIGPAAYEHPQPGDIWLCPLS